jgi:hypothetical protein
VWWKFLRTFPIPGMVTVISAFVIGLGYVMDGYHFIMLGLPPWLIQLIGALLFIASIVGISFRSWTATQIPIKGVSQRSNTERQQTSSQAKTLPWWTVALSSTIVVGLISMILYIILGSNNIEEYRLVLTPFGISPPGDPLRAPNVSAAGLFINFELSNPSNQTISGVTSNYQFEKPDHTLTEREEDKIMRNVIEVTDSPKENGRAIYPHTSGGWTSAFDKKLTINDWHDVLTGDSYLYLFFSAKYLVLLRVRVIESCMILTKELPAVHYCIGHNGAFSYTAKVRN